jgi:alkylation response protein AidB-like acyl-CoA dehydrogenase
MTAASSAQASTATPSPDSVREDVAGWLDDTWSDDLTVGEWWRRLADAKLANSMLPEPWGRGYSREQAVAVIAALTERGALGPPGGIGMMLTVPTLLAHGTEAQILQWVPRILDGQDGWCQLFSEPGAGSDLAGLQTRAERDGDEFVVTGQKVWTSTGHLADWGILIARTDQDQPKHRGISYFAFPMHQEGVEVRPLREMTGRALFNEVFLDGARVAAGNLIGGLNDGWRVANTTLMVERSGIGGANAGGAGSAAPGSVAGHLERLATAQAGKRSGLSSGAVGHSTLVLLQELAAERGLLDDATVRQGLAELHTRLQILRWGGMRAKVASTRTGGEGNIGKIFMSEIICHTRDLAGRILGPDAMLYGPDSVTGGVLQELTLFSPAPSIYGGTDEVQRNIIGERVLGLPKEPGPGRDTSFRDLLHNPVA